LVDQFLKQVWKASVACVRIPEEYSNMFQCHVTLCHVIRRTAT
jgi:hypothetical protein